MQRFSLDEISSRRPVQGVIQLHFQVQVQMQKCNFQLQVQVPKFQVQVKILDTFFIVLHRKIFSIKVTVMFNLLVCGTVAIGRAGNQ